MALFLIIGLFFAAICGGMASSRNRNVFVWAIMGFLFSLLAVIILAVIGKASGGIETAAIGKSTSDEGFMVADELLKLSQLLDKGHINEEEFSIQKRHLLERGASNV